MFTFTYDMTYSQLLWYISSNMTACCGSPITFENNLPHNIPVDHSAPNTCGVVSDYVLPDFRLACLLHIDTLINYNQLIKEY